MKRRKTAWKPMILTLLVFAWLCSTAALAEGASGDNSLSTLGILTEGVTVSPEFYYSTIEYNVTVPAGTTRLELEPVTSHPNASIVDITGQEIGENGETTVVITVSAENGSQYSYYLYVTTDSSTQAAGTVAEQETEPQPQTEPQTEPEPETEDPRYVKVDRNSLQEAENTISALKAETASFRDRAGLLTKILYGMIGLCVILLFVVINLILKKKDLKAELQEYIGYGYPEDGGNNSQNQEQDIPYSEEQGYYDNGQYADSQSYEQYEDVQEYDGGYAEEQSYDDRQYVQDDPATVPKPSRAKKKAKQMPEYQTPEPQHQYEPPVEKHSEKVEVNMIDL